MLLSCSKCHRQYDVGAYPEGSRVRCACGTLNEVKRPRARQVEMLHCSNCGGKLRSTQEACEYCQAEIKLGDRGLGPACPECFCTTFENANHCSSCGVRLEPEAVLRALVDRACPRCKNALSECEGERVRYVECTHCGGLWLDEAIFERIAREKDRAIVPAVRGVLPPAAKNTQTRDEAVRYLPCPVCDEMMSRRNFASCSGVILDWCRGHGWWFDAQELERVLAFLEQGGMERSRMLEHERKRDELARERDRQLERPNLPPMPFERSRRWTVVELLVELLVDFVC
jgi:Zn-finger nucleic acid-binding protein